MVNGVKIFARGADYIPDDCFYPRITREILERDVKACVFANFNCLRVWGGGYYPSDELDVYKRKLKDRSHSCSEETGTGP